MGRIHRQQKHQTKLGWTLLCIVAFSSAINAESTCKKGCPKSDDGFLQYVAGNMYEYNFDSMMTVGVGAVAAGESDDTSLKISGVAKVFAEGNCGYVLQMGAVKVLSTKENAVEKRIAQTITKPVHFTLVGGKLEPEVCADAADDTYSLNIKRAIISMLQASRSEESATEVDVFGQCLTHTAVTKAGSAEVVTKMRNLNNCAYREQLSSGIVNGVVNERAGIKTSMLIEADYVKESKVERGVVRDVQLVEDYHFVGVEKSNANVRAKVSTNLKLKNLAGTPAAAPATGARVASLIFQKPDVHATKNIAALKAAIAEIVQGTGDFVQKDTAKQFVELIRLMRNADADTLLELSAVPHPNKVLARKVYLDALFRTATSESARAIMKQFGKLNDKEKAIAMYSLNLVDVVDKDTVTQVTPLVTPTATKEVFLAAGTLVGRYCQQNSCEHAPEIDAISKKFTDALKHCKANTKLDEDRIVYVLKGIGNTHHLASSAAPVLGECASVGRSLRIRVAALQAFSAASCEDSLRQKALQLLRDHNEDSELRIEAYLAAVTCPTPEMANDIASIVNSEPVYQVGGFISSHLRAIRDSTDLSREQQRHYLGNIRVTKQFPRDLRRFSYNNELSYRLDALGVSASADYKLIYSQHGFLPRSARLNVTTEVFGTNFNVLEASVRQDNLENVVEYYLGPKGLLNKDMDEIVKVSGAGGRERRSIADDSSKFSKKYKTYGSKNVEDMNLDLSLKLFGSEMLFLSLGDDIPNTVDDIIRTFSVVFDNVKREVSNFQKEFNVHALFLDTEVAYPTGIGMPLELSAQGMAASKFDLGLSVDLDAIMEQNWQRAKYRLKVVPSVDVNVDLKLGFNAYVLSTGVQVSSSLHSATGADTNLAFVSENGFTVDIELPRDQIELINVNLATDFYVSEQEKPTRLIQPKVAKKNKPEETEMCFDQLKSVGFTVCISAQSMLGGRSDGHVDALSWAYPYSTRVYVTTERKYHIKGTHVPQTPAGTKEWKLEFSTPGSQESHDTSLTFELGVGPRNFGRLSLEYPQFHFALEAGVNNDDRELMLYAQYENNDEVKKNKLGFEKHGNEYRPVIAIQDKNGATVNDINGYRADGRVVVNKIDDKHARYNFDNFQIINKQNERFLVNGWTDVGPSSLSTELHVAPGQQSYFVKSHFKLDSGVYEFATFVNDEKTPDNILGASVNLKVSEQNVGVEVTGKGFAWELYTNNNLQYEKSDDTNAILSSSFQTEASIKHKQQLVLSLSVNGRTEEKKFEVSATAARGKHSGSLLVKYQSGQHAQNDFLLEVNGKLNKHFLDLMAKCDVSGNRFVIDNVLTTSWGSSLTVKGQLGQRYTPEDIYIDLNGAVQFNAKDKQSKWILKVVGAPEKTVSEFKLNRDKVELVKYNGETLHPQDKVTSGKLNLNIKNVLASKADFKVAKNGKGELNGQIEVLNSEPKHKVEVNSKFHIQMPKYDVETTVTFDADKKLYFKTENHVEKLKFSTKNVAEVADKKMSFDANGQVKGADWRLNGEVIGNFVLNSPTGHVVDGSVKRKVTTNPKTGLTQGTVEVLLNEQVDGKKQTLAWNTKVDKLSVKAREVSAESQLVYTNAENKKLTANTHIKHLPKGPESHVIDISFSTEGDLFTTPIQVTYVVDDYNSKHANYRVSGKYGSFANVNVNGNYEIGERAAPSTFAVQGTLQVPGASFKSFDIRSNGKFLRPSDDDGVGVHLLELHVDESVGNGQFLKLNTLFRGKRQQGSYNFDVHTNNMEGPFKLEGSYQREQSGSLKEGNASGKQKFSNSLTYADKYIRTNTDLSYVGGDTATLHYTLDTSFESAKNIEVEVVGRKTDSDTYNLKMQAKQADNTYVVDSTFYRSEHKKGLDLKINLPKNQKEITVVGIFEVRGDRKAKLTVEVNNLFDLDLQGDVEASYKDVDNFFILGNLNSQRLHLNQYKLDVKSQSKTVTINLVSAEGVVIAGSATYALKKEKNKAIIEGQGQVQYQGKSHNTNFKLIRQVYDVSTDKEIGFSYTFNGNFGPKNGVSTIKLTNKDFNVKLSVCEEKKQCTNVQVQSLVATAEGNDPDSLESIQHSLLALFDLRELGYPYEFEFQSKTIRQGLKVQYSLDSNIISNNNLKYQLLVNIVPSSSKMQLKLPSREILFESQSQYPQSGLFGKYEQTMVFYFDKVRKPNDVTRLTSTFDVTGVDNGLIALNAQGAVRFEHPGTRVLSVSGKADLNRQQQIADIELNFDVFRVPQQKLVLISRTQNTRLNNGFNVTTNQQISSAGLGLQYEFNGHVGVDIERQEFSAAADTQTGSLDMNANAYIYASKNRVDLAVFGLQEPIVQLTGEFNPQNYGSKFETKLHLLGQKPAEIVAEVHPSSAKFAFVRQGMTDANVELILGKELNFHVIGAGKPLVDGRVALDAANFLQATYNRKEENIEAYLQLMESEVKRETEEAQQKLKQRLQKFREFVDRQLQLSKDSLPDFTQLKNSYTENVKELIQELEQDPALKQLADSCREIYGKLAHTAEELTKTLTEVYDKLSKSVISLYEKFGTILKETILPAWEEFMVAATKIMGELRVMIANIYTKAIQVVLDTLEKYGPVLRNYGKAVNEALKPYNEAMQELYKMVSHATEELLKEFKEWVATLPSFEAICAEFKVKLEKLKLAEKTLEFVNAVFEQLHILPTTPETYALMEKTHQYLQAKLQGQKVNDAEVVEELLKLLVKALRSVWQTIELSIPVNTAGSSTKGLESLFVALPSSFDFMSSVPSLLSFRFSVINFLLNEDWEALLSKESLHNWIYFQDLNLRGHIADGHHIFTFDGQYFGFRGTCKYILAQDSTDNNFTVVAQLNNGKLKSITLADRDGHFMELNDAGALKLNGNAVEYPVHDAGGMHAWRKYYTIWLLSEYGVEVMCTTDLKLCHIDINGFYTSKIRGLFGNGNAEPYDDFMLVDGTIAPDSASFGNAYGLGKCNPVAPEQMPADSRADVCSELFGLESPLAYWYLVQDSHPFRDACDRAVLLAPEKDKEAAACNIALTYASSLALNHQHSALPSRCLKCAGAAGQRDLYQEFTVKIPSNKADVVFVVDIGVKPAVLSNLVAPAITEIRETLKARGFTDVQIGVVAYNESQLYPALLTSDNGKLNYHGNIATVELNGPKGFCDSCVSQVVTDRKVLSAYEIIEEFVKSIIPQSDELAFELALNYPFRAGAAKSIVDVRSSNLEYGNVLKLVRAHFAEAITEFDGALLHLLAPVKGMSLEGVAPEKLIGFNSRLVATLDGKDAKKRQKLQFENDMGIDFVLNSGGWVFNTEHFESLKAPEQKKALNQVTNSIADTLFKTEIVSDCKCLPTFGLHAQHRCTVKSSNFVPNKKVKAGA